MIETYENNFIGSQTKWFFEYENSQNIKLLFQKWYEKQDENMAISKKERTG